MRYTISCFISMVFIVLLGLTRSARGDFASQLRIDYVCLQTSYYEYCREVYNAHLSDTVTSHDFKELTQIALVQTLIYTGEALVFMKMSERNETEQTLKGLYRICGEAYDFVVRKFKFGTLAFARGDMKSMLSEIETCGIFVEYCEKVLGDKVSAVHEKNLFARVLVRMSIVSGGLIR